MKRMLVLVVALASCGRENETCAALTSCLAGGYQFCKSGASCVYHLTDGTQVDCASCSDCVAAIDLVERWCDPSTNPFDLAQPVDLFGPQSLPDLASNDLAVSILNIPKSGNYTGAKTDPMLDDISKCADAYLEPNDLRSPIEFTPPPDMPTAKIIKLAICPAGARDTDWFKVDLASPLYMTAQIFYDVTKGDLDVAIVGTQGQIISADGSAISNGCTSSQVGPGFVYVVITGANNIDVNNYELLIKTWAAPHACP